MEYDRIVMAVKWLSELRDIIERNGGVYTGMEVPNIQSIMEVLIMPNRSLQMHMESIPEEFQASLEEVNALRYGWEK